MISQMQTAKVETGKDFIVAGIFFSDFDRDSDLTGSQVRAIQLVEKIGTRLAKEHPEIVELYRSSGDFQRYIDIAFQYISEAEMYPGVASKAVGYAMRLLMSKEERRRLSNERHAQRIKKFFGGFDSKKFRDHCRAASKRRHELGIGVDVDALLKGRGRTRWSEEEKEYTLRLVQNPDYQHFRGRPNYELIALELNIMFHDCEEIRYTNSVASFIRHTRKMEKKKKLHR
ncbi:hypothetical protein ACFL0Z_02505 [Patescibacteria group bacterium]